MGVALAVVTVETIKTLIVRTARAIGRAEPPFSESAGGVACGFEGFGQRDGFIGDRPLYAG